MSTNPILTLNNVSKLYNNPSGSTTTQVLNNISLSVSPASTTAIVGPSGSGKSTLLNLMGLLDKPSSGQVIVNNTVTEQLSDHDSSLIRNQAIGFIFQLHHLLPQCSVLENVLIPTLAFPKESKTTYYNRAKDLILSVGLQDRLNHRPAELSGGEQLRTAVARSLINQPKLLLADEPTGSLDHKTGTTITDLLLKINHDHDLALVVVTHSTQVANVMDNQYELLDGLLKQL